MVFSSLTFLFLFLPAVLLIYFLTPVISVKNIFLLLVSLLFYAWGEPNFVVLMVLSTLVNYLAGLMIASSSYRRVWLACSVILNLSFLVYFKYAVFIVRTANRMLHFGNLPLTEIAEITLPIGISFYTFQSISYLIDTYRKPETVQRNPLDLGLYIAFFPQLIAGPIVRYFDIREQIKSRSHSIDDFAKGVERFIVGLSKKVLIANTAGQLADRLFDSPVSSLDMSLAWLGMVAYTLQIFYDFSGYSDMAIGLGRMFGFRFLENFNYPYSATSITDFWRRWHISLSTWFRDYLYIPLGGNRVSLGRTRINLFIVFFATGVWHGAAFSFIAWGLLHGFFLSLEKQFRGLFPASPGVNGKARGLLGWAYAILVVMFLWVVFRVDLPHAIQYWQRLLSFAPAESLHDFVELKARTGLLLDGWSWTAFAAGFLFAFPHETIASWLRSKENRPAFEALRLITSIGLLLLCIARLSQGAYNPFIYFRF